MREKAVPKADIKQYNRSNIYHLLWENKGLTRQDMVSRLGICLPTVVKNLTELEREGLVAESGRDNHTGGRSAKTYSAVADARIALGLDLTLNHITAVAVDLQGDLIAYNRLRHRFAQTPDYRGTLTGIVQALIADNCLERERILGMGIGVPGLVSADRQMVAYGKSMGFTGAKCEDFAADIPFPARLYHDTSAAGLAETWKQASKGNVFYLMLGNSVGGSVFLAGREYRGDHTRSAEVGHMTIVPDGKPCYCGQRGCADPYLSAEVLTARGGTLEDFFRLLGEGDAVAAQIWEDYLHHLAATVNNLRMLFDCRVIIGGTVGAFFDDYIGDLRRLAGARDAFESRQEYLYPCSRKQGAVAVGAALPFLMQYLSGI